ncbi:MAG TPA: hypothetical protein VGL25_01690 [Casimicrobiaceae bacterium]|jgi:6-phosphogluconolactonase (cycloisomerase 2 family)
MNKFAAFYREIAMTVLTSLAASGSALAATFVYVSNAEDGDIVIYRMQPGSGELQPGPRVKAGATVMPMAVSADRRFLYAAVRSKPYSVIDLFDRSEHRRIANAVDIVAAGEHAIHRARQDGAISIRRLLWWSPDQCQLGRQ